MTSGAPQLGATAAAAALVLGPSPELSQPWRSFRPSWLLAAAHAGSLTPASGPPLALRLDSLAPLALPSGHLVLTDPYDLASPSDALALTRTMPLPRALLTLVRLAGSGLERDMFGDLREGSQAVVALLLSAPGAPRVHSWEMASWPGLALASSEPAESTAVVGVHTSSQVIALGDPAGLAPVLEVLSQDAGAFDDELSARLFASPGRAVVLSAPGRPPVLLAEVGYPDGDGMLPAWWGLDASGTPVAFLLDGSIADDPIRAGLSLAAEQALLRSRQPEHLKPVLAQEAPSRPGFLSRLTRLGR